MNQPFLNVEKSLSGKKWIVPNADERAITRIMQAQGMPEIISRLLVHRNVDIENVQDFLKPQLQNLPDPCSLKDMDKLARYLADAIENKKALGIFADFDVDGATSAAILHRFFKNFGLTVPFTIPDRLNEGYGPNIPALARMKQEGIESVIIADCGITSHDIIEAGRKMGLDIIVLDHHEPIKNKPLPDANIIIDPKREDDNSNLDYLCAAGVCWMACYATGKELLKRGYVTDRSELKLGDLLDLVAFGTVCDMVPLIGINRTLVKAGMNVMQKREKPGIDALAHVSKVSKGKEINSFHLGFGFGPRINAGSRMLDSSLGARLLSTDNDREALEISQVLDELNEQRKTLSKELQKEALKSQEGNDNYYQRITIAVLPEAHGDVKGLVASDLCQKFGRPALALMPKVDAETGEALLNGSARSVKGFDVAAMMFAATEAGHLLKGGGHAMAGGCTLKESQLQGFMNWLPTYMDGINAPNEYLKELELDGISSVQGSTVDAIQILDKIAPYGQGNREPKFAFANVHIFDAKAIGEDKTHISCRISEVEGGRSIKAVAFRSTNTPIGEALLKNSNQNIAMHIAGTLNINEWNGHTSAQMIIEDAALMS